MPKTYLVTNRIIFSDGKEKNSNAHYGNWKLATNNSQSLISMIRKLGNQKISIAKKMVNVHPNIQK
jgi:hypothetical protein